MAHLPTDPADFASRAIDGFVRAHPRHVRRVDGGVVRLAPIPTGQVGLVVGGGSGHYPAFAGLVGRGMAAGAVCGNVFASPSAGQVERVGLAVERGGGLLLAFGNYAGDVLQFSVGAERLRSQGIDVRIVTVSDDIASGPADQPELRRGIAGGLFVYKVAGAAAEAGLDLDAVERLARRANERTRTLGVAFSGCTLPGASAPLFEVPHQRMGIGMGLHGEPGLSEGPILAAEPLAALLVERLLAERPAGVTPGHDRVVVLLNGLGTFKYEELFTLFGAVDQQLQAAGVEMADCECGELVTSLDMAGVSLSLCWLDGDLEPLWRAAADSPAYRRGALAAAADSDAPAAPAAIEAESAAAMQAPGHGPLAPGGQALLARLRAVQQAMEEREPELGALDAVAGDGDHGLGMRRGSAAAVASAARTLAQGGSLPQLLQEAGEAWSDQGGGTSGAIWGAGLQAAGQHLAATTPQGRPPGQAHAPLAGDPVGGKHIAGAVAAALEAVMALGKAVPGDKTLVDALHPFSERLAEGLAAGESLELALGQAAASCLQAAQATADLLPRLGRARPHGSRSLGHPDPGAMSLAYAVVAATAPPTTASTPQPPQPLQP